MDIQPCYNATFLHTTQINLMDVSTVKFVNSQKRKLVSPFTSKMNIHECVQPFLFLLKCFGLFPVFHNQYFKGIKMNKKTKFCNFLTPFCNIVAIIIFLTIFLMSNLISNMYNFGLVVGLLSIFISMNYQLCKWKSIWKFLNKIDEIDGKV